MARKLKGKNTEKLKGTKKEKMEKTLKRMDKSREEDNIRIRTLIETKVVALEEEKIKADNYIRDSLQKIESIKAAKLKIEGAIISLKEVLNHATETKPNG